MKNKSIREKAWAKVNLALDVTGRLPNGYHNVKMVMESISLHDDLSIVLSDEPGIRLKCTSDDPKIHIDTLSTGEDNLIIKAARAILDRVPASSGIDADSIGLDISLKKRIPMAAGLAGGSSDAAATLRGVNRLLQLGLRTDELCNIGLTLGADIPYCVIGGSFLAEGVGEVLTPLPPMPRAHVLIVKPDIEVSTSSVYDRIDKAKISSHPDIDGMISAITAGNLRGISMKVGNVLRDVTVADHPIISEIEEDLRDHGASAAMMSGSGPTVFGIIKDSEICDGTMEYMELTYPDMFIARAEFL